jgi:lactate permease
MAVMTETGALPRIIAFIKTVAPTNRCVQMLVINCGIGILLTSFGALTIAIFPPILMGLGYSVFAAIALPCIGYTGGCIYAIMGVPVLIFASQAGISLNEAGLLFAELLPLMLSAVSLACLWLTGGKDMLARGWIPALAASVISGLTALPLARAGMVTLTGMVVGAVYVLALLAALRLTGQPALAAARKEGTPSMGLAAALSPWIALIVFSIAVNTPALPFYQWFFSDLSMPAEIIPGRPERLRVFWQPYFWIPVTTLLCGPFLGITRRSLAASARAALRRAPRPVAAIALFFAIASLYVYSGYAADWQPPADGTRLNMISVLSACAADILGKGYIAASPFLGLLGGVLSGSQSGGIAMLTRLHLGVAAHIGASGSLLALFSALGSGLAGAISPAKVMTAAAVIDRIGEEGAVLRSILGIVLLVSLATAVAAVVWSAV